MKAYLTTDTHVELADFSSAVPSTQSVVGTAGTVSLFVPDGSGPYYVFLNKNTNTLYKIDANTNMISGQLYYKYFIDVKAMDVDLATGDIYLLQPYGLVVNPEELLESSSSVVDDPNVYLSSVNMVLGGGIMRIDSSFSGVQHINPTTRTGKIYFRMPQDMKIDSVNRKLFVSDTANNRVLRLNLNTYLLEQVFTDENMLMPSSLAISKVGDLFVIHYDKNDMKQKVSWFKNEQKQCEFQTTNAMSLSNFSYGNEDKAGWAYVLDEDGLYEVTNDSMSKNKWHTLGFSSPHSLATSWVSNSTVVKYAAGAIEKLYRTQQSFGNKLYAGLQYGFNPRMFVGHLNDAFYDIAYDRRRRGHYIKQIGLDAPGIDTDVNIPIKLADAVGGDACLMNGNVYVLSDAGRTLLKIDAQRKILIKTMDLGSRSFDFVSVSPREEKIWLASSITRELAYTDRNFNTLHVLGVFIDDVTRIHYDFWDENVLWITSQSKTYRYDANSSTYVSLAIPSTSVRGICPSLYDYVWVFDQKKLYKVNNSCTAIQGTSSGFKDVKDISCLNQMKDLFASGYLPQSGQIKYDAVRGNAAWVYDESLYVANSRFRTGAEIKDFESPVEFYSESSDSGDTTSLLMSGTSESSSSFNCAKCTHYDIKHLPDSALLTTISNFSFNGLTVLTTTHCNAYVKLRYFYSSGSYHAEAKVYSDPQFMNEVASSDGVVKSNSDIPSIRVRAVGGSAVSGTIYFTSIWNEDENLWDKVVFVCLPYGESSSFPSTATSLLTLSSQSSIEVGTSSLSSVSSPSSSSSSTVSTSSSSKSFSSVSSESSLTSTTGSASSMSLSSSSTVILTSSSSSTKRFDTSSSMSTASTNSSSSSSTGIEFYVVQQTASFSNYDAIGQTYSGTGTPGATIYAPKTGSYAANEEQRYGYLPENPMVRVPYWDTSYLFSAENSPHSSNTIFINLRDSGNLHLKDPVFFNLMYGSDMQKIAYDYPCWGIKRLWIQCMKADGTSVGTIALPINEQEQDYRWEVTPLNAAWAFEGDGNMMNGIAWIGRNRNLSLTYKFDGLPAHALVSVHADIHFRGNWLGCAEQTSWKYNPGKTTEYSQVKNPYQEGYVAPVSNPVEVKQVLSHGPHTFSIMVR